MASKSRTISSGAEGGRFQEYNCQQLIDAGFPARDLLVSVRVRSLSSRRFSVVSPASGLSSASACPPGPATAGRAAGVHGRFSPHSPMPGRRSATPQTALRSARRIPDCGRPGALGQPAGDSADGRFPVAATPPMSMVIVSPSNRDHLARKNGPQARLWSGYTEVSAEAVVLSGRNISCQICLCHSVRLSAPSR